ncbi:DUF362 domain-containing protein [Candidatus Latescibacterota bacterium]
MSNHTYMFNTIEKTLFQSYSRRSVHKILLANAIAGCMYPLTGMAMPERSIADKRPVSFATGTDRREMIAQVLKPIEREIVKEISGKKKIIIKCNLVAPEPLSATHVDAVRGILDVITRLYDGPIYVGDSTGRTYPGPIGTMRHFEIHGYLDLPREYNNVKLLDLNDCNTNPLWILDDNQHPRPVNIIDTFLDPDVYNISLTRFKTHGRLITVTLGVKNMVMGSPISHYRQQAAAGRNEKVFMHSGEHSNLNVNMFFVAQRINVGLSVLDGFVGMEGNGAAQGTPVEHGVALAGTDIVAVDKVGTHLMDIDFEEVLYLKYCGDAGLGQSDLSSIDIIGPSLDEHIIQYRRHDNNPKLS